MSATLYFNGPKQAFQRAVDANVLAAWQLPVVPSYTTSGGENIDLNITKFGNGYSQVALNGLNSVSQSFKVVFSNRRMDVIREIRNFLLGKGPFYTRPLNQYFYWTPPAPWDTEGKFLCNKVSVVFPKYNSFTINAVFEQVFHP